MKLSIFLEKTKGLLLLIFVLLVGFGCSTSDIGMQSTENSNENDTLQIYTTLYPLEDFTKKIGGDHIEVKSIIPPGVDPHSFEPSTKSMIDIAKADAFIYSSQTMEQYAAEISESLKNEEVAIVEAADGIEMIEHHHEEENNTNHEEHYSRPNDITHKEDGGEIIDDHQADESHEHAHDDFDPHVWMDPILSIKLSENIKNMLVELKPAAKNEFESNFQSLKQQLEKLDHEFHVMVGQKKDPKILVSHAAYGYWENNYGIKQIAVTGLSPTNEPSQKQLEDIIQTAKENNIKYVIFEKNITTKITEIVKNELKAEALYLHNLAILTDEDIKRKDDYFSLMRKNIETLDQAMK
ncbi:metal ABC transporter solute-binding protein, Zn/Mn family [Calidifontibacillus oryziterrae]|uniref:metal ABC transporter solute-binding protein, Zn/Mn family n=1 Tax=Calidifontibacillus oryziterrae TaxID=1191699 RepID=UPI0002F1BF5F|nr:zinc ABC transporter substrate-binding protein [Calidifontibacillus oryziterrae]